MAEKVNFSTHDDLTGGLHSVEEEIIQLNFTIERHARTLVGRVDQKVKQR